MFIELIERPRDIGLPGVNLDVGGDYNSEVSLKKYIFKTLFVFIRLQLINLYSLRSMLMHPSPDVIDPSSLGTVMITAKKSEGVQGSTKQSRLSVEIKLNHPETRNCNIRIFF